MFWKRQNFRARNQISGFWEWRWGEGTDSEGTGGNLGSDGAVLGLDCGVITRLCQNSSNCIPKKGEFLNANSNNLNANYTPVSLAYTSAHTGRLISWLESGLPGCLGNGHWDIACVIHYDFVADFVYKKSGAAKNI